MSNSVIYLIIFLTDWFSDSSCTAWPGTKAEAGSKTPRSLCACWSILGLRGHPKDGRQRKFAGLYAGPHSHWLSVDVLCYFHSLFTVCSSLWNYNSSLTDMFCEFIIFLFHVCCLYGCLCLSVCLSVCLFCDVVCVCLWDVLPDFK